MKELLAFIGTAFFWGTSFLWIKVALQEVSPWFLVSARLTFGALGLFLLLRVYKQSVPTRKQWFSLFRMSLLHPLLPFLLLSWAETYIDSGVASILNGTVPLFTIICAHLVLQDDKITLPRMLGLIVGFLGVIVLMTRGDFTLGSAEFSDGAYRLLGKIAVLGTAFLYCCGSIYAKKYLNQIPAITQAFGVLTCSCISSWIIFGITLVFDSPFKLPTQPQTWVALLWLGFFGSCLAFAFYFHLVRTWGATRATLVNYAFPVIGLVLGILFLNEKVDLRLFLGSLMIVAGIFIVNSRELLKNSRSRARAKLGEMR